MQPATERDGVAGHHVLAGHLALLDLRDPALGDPHALGHLLLGHPPRPTDLGQPVAEDAGQQLLLTGLDRDLTTGPLDVLGADVVPGDEPVHHRSSFARSSR